MNCEGSDQMLVIKPHLSCLVRFDGCAHGIALLAMALSRLQVFSLSPSHQIFGHMHGVLNVDKKITNYTV